MNATTKSALIKKAFVAWNSHNPRRVGAALGFYGLLSIAPLLVFFIPLGRYVFRHQHIEPALVPSIGYIIGPEAPEALALLESQLPKRRFSGLAANLLAIITLLFGTSATFGELRNALNTTWNIPAVERHNLAAFIRWHLFAVGMGILTACVLLLSVAVSVAFRLSAILHGAPARAVALRGAANFILSFGVLVVLTALIYKFVPDVSIAWKDVSLGVAVTAFLLVLGKSILGFYVGRFGLGSLYGVASSLIAFTVWVYYSAQIVLFGAEVIRVYVQQKATEATVSAV